MAILAAGGWPWQVFCRPARCAVWLLSLLLAGCGDYEARLNFGKGEIIYDGATTESEARRLGQSLLEHAFFDQPAQVRLVKVNDTYQVQLPTEREMLADPEFLDAVRWYCHELSADVFQGAPVQVALCDSKLQPITTLRAEGTSKLLLDRAELYFTAEVDVETAGRIGQWLLEDRFLADNEVTLLLSREGPRWSIAYPMEPGYVPDEAYVQATADRAARLSREVLDGQPVDFHLCDERLKTLRVVSAAP